MRDFQKARVYRWQCQLDDALMAPVFSLEEARAWLLPIWEAERAAAGLTQKRAPAIESSHWGQRRALAYTRSHRITLPLWARSKWVVLHEAAHLLTPGEHHGPRFVGMLIGLASRHLGCNPLELFAAAESCGVRWSLETLGALPRASVSWHVREALRTEGPLTPMQLGCHLSLGLGLSYGPNQIRGGILSLVRRGHASWRGRKVVFVGGAGQR